MFCGGKQLKKLWCQETSTYPLQSLLSDSSISDDAKNLVIAIDEDSDYADSDTRISEIATFYGTTAYDMISAATQF